MKANLWRVAFSMPSAIAIPEFSYTADDLSQTALQTTQCVASDYLNVNIFRVYP